MKTIAQQLNVKKFPFFIKDSNGNIIYHEDSDSYWAKIEYDSKGNQIYFENSEGYWEKNEFDSNGDRIYRENSDGVIEDNRVPEYTMEELVEKIGNFKLKNRNYNNLCKI